MPAIRRILKRNRTTVNTLTFSQRHHLTSSWRGVGPMYQTLEEFTTAWESVRDEILPRWIERNPGSRPFAWWRCDHGQERPIVDGPDWMTPDRLDGMRNEARHWQTFGYLHNCEFIEPEEAYLRRNGLLEPGEEEAIATKLLSRMND